MTITKKQLLEIYEENNNNNMFKGLIYLSDFNTEYCPKDKDTASRIAASIKFNNELKKGKWCKR